MSKNLIARISVAIIFIPIILWICYQGGYWLFGMIALFSIIGMAEFLHGEKINTYPVLYFLSFLSLGVVLISLFYISARSVEVSVSANEYFKYLDTFSLTLIIFFLLSTILLAIKKREPQELFNISSRATWGLVYLGGLFPFVLLLGNGTWTKAMLSGGDLLLFLFCILWIGDTSAMFFGKQFGKHKIAPVVSPNKTVEGFAGGLVGALIVGIIFYFWKMNALPIHHVLSLSIGSSLFGQLGDLVESMWKRSINIKDSSSIIPGHGACLIDLILYYLPRRIYFSI